MKNTAEQMSLSDCMGALATCGRPDCLKDEFQAEHIERVRAIIRRVAVIAAERNSPISRKQYNYVLAVAAEYGLWDALIAKNQPA